MRIEDTIKDIIKAGVAEARRPDLFREPLCAFSLAGDRRYAELKTIVGPWHKNPEELLPDAKSVISFFVPFTEDIVRSVRTQEPVSRNWGEAYVVVNDLFDEIGQTIADLLKKMGYSALPIAATHTYDPQTLRSMWSHRSAAAIAGLGSFGANRMLFTESGSAGRCCTVVTSAELEAGKEPAPEYCLYHIDGSCLICLEVCPVKALTLESIDRFACNTHLLKNAERLSEVGFCDVCGKCVANCPVSYIETQRT